MNSLQALKNLRKSAIEQSKELESLSKEIHQENWNKLSSDLKDITREKLEKIRSDIKRENKTILENIDYELEQLRKNKIRNYIIIATVSLIIGSIAGAMLTKALFPWIVPEQMRYTNTDGSKWVKTTKEPQTVDGITYIQLEGK